VVNVTARLSSGLPYALILFLYFIARYSALGAVIGGYGRERHVPHDIVRIAGNIVVFSARALFPPMRALKAIFAIVCIVWIWLCYKSRKNRALMLLSLFLLSSFLLFLLPVIGLSINYAKDTQGERFVYLPSVFIVVFVVFMFYYALRKRVMIFLSFGLCIAASCAILLWKTNGNWNKAGIISKNIVYSLNKVPQANTIFIISLPDTINGAYIFRNGILSAFDLFVGRDYFKRIYVLSLCDISNENDGIVITSNGDYYYVGLISKNGNFKKINRYYCSRISTMRFVFNKPKAREVAPVIFYASGKVGMRIVE